MPVTFQIDKNANVVIVTADGTISEDDIVHQVTQQLGDAEYRQHMNTLYDFRRSHFVGGHEQLKSLANQMSDKNVIRHPSKTAIIVKEDYEFGLARMYSLLADVSLVEYRVFRDPMEAMRWLNLPEDYLGGN